MPKAGKFNAALQYLRSKGPQLGFFSTLDELIESAPFGSAPASEWRKYLSPGRALVREDVSFPLKSEEIEYTNLDEILADSGRKWTRGELLEVISKGRPTFQVRLGTWNPDPPLSEAYNLPRSFGEINPEIRSPRFDQPEFAHTVDMIPRGYEESVTTSPDFGSHPEHFGQKVISWGRTTRHRTPEGRLARLVEEIQSDRHSAAAERVYQDPENPDLYRTPQELKFHGIPEEQIRGLPSRRVGYDPPRGLPPVDDAFHVPDAPFKDPADYARLELRKQLLNAAEEGDDYLALTGSKEQIDRYSGRMDEQRRRGMVEMYDRVYPGVLRRLAQQYGIPFREVELSLSDQRDLRPPTLSELDIETAADFVEGMLDDVWDNVEDPDYPAPILRSAKNLLSEYEKRITRQSSRWAIENVRALIDELGVPGISEPRFSKISRALRGLFPEIEKDYLDAMRKEIPPKIRKLPAAHLTPELREKIKRIGVPIWSLGAGTVLVEPEENEFSKGGKVKSASERLLELIRQYAPEWEEHFTEHVTPGFDQSRKSAIPRETVERELKRLRGYAEGGGVKGPQARRGPHKKRPSKSIRMISDVARLLGPEGGAENRQRVAAGLLSQLYGLDDEGNPRFPWKLGNIGPVGIYSPVPMIPPGIVDETLAIPSLIDVFKEEDEPRDAPEWSHRSADRTEQLMSRIREEMGLDEPQGFWENLDEGLGIMAGQVPVPSSALSQVKALKPVVGPEPHRIVKLARKLGMPLRPLLEFLFPSIDPKVQNYVIGAAVPGVLGAVAEENPETEELP